MSADNSLYAGECKFLRDCVRFFVVSNLGIIAVWIVCIVVNLEVYITDEHFFSSFEIAMAVVATVYLSVLYVKFWRTGHQIFKKIIGTCLELGIFSISVLVVFSALKFGVAHAMNYVTYYLDSFPKLKLQETKLMEMVLLYPGFVCFYVTAILHMGIKALRVTAVTYNLLRSGETLDNAYAEENEAEEADDY